MNGQYTCDFCGKEFSSKFFLKIHMNVCSDLRLFKFNGGKFKCDRCRKTMSSKRNLERHITVCKLYSSDTEKAPRSNSGKFKCDRCRKTMTSKRNLERHITVCKLYNSDTEKAPRPNGAKFKCDRCRKTMSSMRDLERHITVCKLYNSDTEKAPRPHSCHVCGKTFMSGYSVRRHMTSHSESRNHGCGICLKTFKHKYHVQRHIKHVHPAVQDNSQIYCIRSQYPPQSEYARDEKNAGMPQTEKLTSPHSDGCLRIDHNGMSLNSNAVSSPNIKENLSSGIDKEVESIPGCDVMEGDGSHSDDGMICIDDVSSALDTRVGGEDDVVIVVSENKNLELENIESLNSLSEQTPSLDNYIMITEVTLSNHKETNNSQSYDANSFKVHDVEDDADSLQQNRREETGRTAVEENLGARVGVEDGDVIVGRENKNLELENIESLNSLSEQTPSLGIMITEVTSLSNHKETNNSQSHDANSFKVHDVEDDADSLQQNRREETGRMAVEENLDTRVGVEDDDVIVGRENKNLELENIESLNNLSEQTPSLGIMITEVTSLSNHKETNNSQSHDANSFKVHDVEDDADSLQQNRWEETGHTAVEENLFSQSGSFCDEAVSPVESYRQSSEKTLEPLRYSDGLSVEAGHIIGFSYSELKSCGSLLQEPLYTTKNSDPLQCVMPVESHYSKDAHSNYVLSDELYFFMPRGTDEADRRACFLEIQAVSEWMGKEFVL